MAPLGTTIPPSPPCFGPNTYRELWKAISQTLRVFKIAAFFPKVPSHPRMQPRKGSRQRSHLWLPDPASKANKPVCLPLSLRSPWWEKPNPDSGSFCGPRSKPVQGRGLPEIAELLAAWVHLLGWCWGYLKG